MLNRAKLWDNCKDFIKGVVLQFGLLRSTSDRIVEVVIKPAVLSKKLTVTADDEKSVFAKFNSVMSSQYLISVKVYQKTYA